LNFEKNSDNTRFFIFELNTRKHEIFVEHIRDFAHKSMSSLEIREPKAVKEVEDGQLEVVDMRGENKKFYKVMFCVG
jgi:hypothetical protein